MYETPHFKSDDPVIAAELMRGNPFALLTTTDADGVPFVTHLPLVTEEAREGFVLRGHVARANPHWRYLIERPSLVVFLGPHAYQSPNVYPDLNRVPSWNYLAVHCVVRARLVNDAAGKEALLKQLIEDHELAYVQQWAELDEGYQQRMLAGIVGFELIVTSWQCKLKLNQHRPESHGALRAAYAKGGANEKALGQWMARLGLGAKRTGRRKASSTTDLEP